MRLQIVGARSIREGDGKSQSNRSTTGRIHCTLVCRDAGMDLKS